MLKAFVDYALHYLHLNRHGFCLKNGLQLKYVRKDRCMFRILTIFCFLMVVCFSCEVFGVEEVVPAEPEKEKSELAKLMNEIDTNYKTVEEMSGWYKYKKKHWGIILESGQKYSDINKIYKEKIFKTR
jgi:hypothetical protein